MAEPTSSINGWYIAAIVVGLLVAVDLLLVPYASTEPSALFAGVREIDCGNGFNIVRGNAPEACLDDHRGVATARLVVGGGICWFLGYRGEKAEPEK